MKTVLNNSGFSIEVETSVESFEKYGFKKLRAGQKALTSFGKLCTIEGVKRSWRSISVWYTIDGHKWSSECTNATDDGFIPLGEEKTIMSVHGKPIKVHTSSEIFKKLGFDHLYAGRIYKLSYPYDCLCIIEGIQISGSDEKTLWISMADQNGATDRLEDGTIFSPAEAAMKIIFFGKTVILDISKEMFIEMGFKKLRFGDRVIMPHCNYAVILLGFGTEPPDGNLGVWWNTEFVMFPIIETRGMVLWYKADDYVHYFCPLPNEQEFQRA